MNGTASFELDIPCVAQWHVWVRGFDNFSQDSFRVKVDQLPDPALIFEIDCTSDGEPAYRWVELNQRESDAPPCEYVTNPWIQSWGASTHELVFLPREDSAISRVIVTADPNFVPADGD